MGNLARLALVICAATRFAGCGGSQLPLGAPDTMPQSIGIGRPLSSGYRVLHRFKDSIGGKMPLAPLIDVHGTLYGTTYNGGSYGLGTVYRISTRGVKTTLYSFRGGFEDGAGPAGLVYVNGTFYGTTFNGGQPSTKCWISGQGGSHHGCGTVFSVTASGQEKVIYFFQPPPEPGNPFSGLIDIHGVLYGTTLGGGIPCRSQQYGCGTVYRLTTAGKETTLYKFAGYPDGQFPGYGDLLDIGGTLYGTTWAGGGWSAGAVYSVTMKGKESVLYSFQNSPDGKAPYSGVIDVNGALYGATLKGGDGGCGTVYGITTQGEEHIVYQFGCGADGAEPVGVAQINGLLYGATMHGGTKCRKNSEGCGIIFSLTTSGAEQILHTFTGGGNDGGVPLRTLLSVNGTLYGTTSEQPGTVFALTP